MNRLIGAGIAFISSMTIDGDGNKILTSVDEEGVECISLMLMVKI